MSTEEINPTQPQLLAKEIRKKFHGVNAELGARKEYFEACCAASRATRDVISKYDSAVDSAKRAAAEHEKAKIASNAEGEATSLRTQTSENIARRERENADDRLSLAAEDLKTTYDTYVAARTKAHLAFEDEVLAITEGKRKQPEAPTAATTTAGAEKRVRGVFVFP